MISYERIVRGIAVAAVIAIPAFAVACGDDDDDDTGNATTTAPSTSTTVSEATRAATTAASASGGKVNVADNVFAPATVTVKVGDKVTWTWAGSNPHSVVGKFDNADVKSQTQSAGSFDFTFTKAGTFDYQCGVHGASMPGKITIQ